MWTHQFSSQTWDVNLIWSCVSCFFLQPCCSLFRGWIEFWEGCGWRRRIGSGVHSIYSICRAEAKLRGWRLEKSESRQHNSSSDCWWAAPSTKSHVALGRRTNEFSSQHARLANTRRQGVPRRCTPQGVPPPDVSRNLWFPLTIRKVCCCWPGCDYFCGEYFIYEPRNKAITGKYIAHKYGDMITEFSIENG